MSVVTHVPILLGTVLHQVQPKSLNICLEFLGVFQLSHFPDSMSPGLQAHPAPSVSPLGGPLGLGHVCPNCRQPPRVPRAGRSHLPRYILFLTVSSRGVTPAPCRWGKSAPRPHSPPRGPPVPPVSGGAAPHPPLVGSHGSPLLSMTRHPQQGKWWRQVTD